MRKTMLAASAAALIVSACGSAPEEPAAQPTRSAPEQSADDDRAIEAAYAQLRDETDGNKLLAIVKRPFGMASPEGKAADKRLREIYEPQIKTADSAFDLHQLKSYATYPGSTWRTVYDKRELELAE